MVKDKKKVNKALKELGLSLPSVPLAQQSKPKATPKATAPQSRPAGGIVPQSRPVPAGQPLAPTQPVADVNANRVKEGAAFIRAREKLENQGFSKKEANAKAFEQTQNESQNQVGVGARAEFESQLDAELSGALGAQDLGTEQPRNDTLEAVTSVGLAAGTGLAVAGGVVTPVGIAGVSIAGSSLLVKGLTAAGGLFSLGKITGKPNKQLNDLQAVVADSAAQTDFILQSTRAGTMTREQAISQLARVELNINSSERAMNQIIDNTPGFFVDGGKDALVDVAFAKDQLETSRQALIEILAGQASQGLR